MDTICRVCIKKATECTLLNTKIENSSKLSFCDFLNKCTSLNACESDDLPQKLCSICTSSIKTLYSFVKLAEKSNTILREALKNSIETGRYNDNREISSEEIILRIGKIKEESEDFIKEESLHCPAYENSTGSSLYILDILKEEPGVSESTIGNFKDAEINESDEFYSNLDHLEGTVEELGSIDAERSDFEDDVPLDETDSQSSFLSKTHCINSNLKKKTGKIKAESKEVEVKTEEGGSSDGFINSKIEYENHISIGNENRKQVSIQANDVPSKSHIRGNTENIFKCTYCDMVFNDRFDFRIHRRNHIKDIKYDCNICGKKFARRDYLYNHLAVHNEKRKYKCSYCEKSFKHHSGRWKHMLIHSGEKPFQCEICGKKFSLKNRYNIHLRSHTRPRIRPDKKHECEICSKRFMTKHYLNVHMEHHNGITKKCDQCGKVFKNSDTLSRHMKLHINPKPFKCEKCDQKFSAKRSLDIHMENHDGIKKKCDQCGKEFKNSAILTSHMKWHMNPKTFKCVNCGKSFSRKSGVARHMLICKSVGNSNEDTVKIEESSFRSSNANHSYESAEAPIIQFYEVRELEEDNNKDNKLTGVCIKKEDDGR